MTLLAKKGEGWVGGVFIYLIREEVEFLANRVEWCFYISQEK